MQKKWFQNLYRIAAPFMRNPEKVASYLSEIVGWGQIVDGAIYSRRNSLKQNDFIYDERNEEFLKLCQKIIDPFLIS
jgi:hypothetical protein